MIVPDSPLPGPLPILRGGVTCALWLADFFAISQRSQYRSRLHGHMCFARSFYVVTPYALQCTWNWTDCCLETFPNCTAIEICGQRSAWWRQSALLYIHLSSLDLLLCHLQGPPHHWRWDFHFPNPKPGPVLLPATFRLEWCGLSALQFHVCLLPHILLWWSWAQHLKLPSSPPIKRFLLKAALVMLSP